MKGVERGLGAVFILLWLCAGQGCSFSIRSPNYLQQAEEFSRKQEYDRAVEAYRSHMQQRLNVRDRPEWENPYFYLILIGDIDLGRGNVDDAVRAYEEAEERGVDQYLVLDRFRSVGRWYEQQSRLDDAIKFLGTKRSKDELLIDAMLDRLSKELVAKEDAQVKQGGGK